MTSPDRFGDPERFPHGTRARYVGARCRCEPCRLANREYARGRYRAKRLRGEWNGLVPVAEARRHILALARRGVGRRAVAEASGVARTIVVEIAAGRRPRVRQSTVARILAVDEGARLDGSLVPADRLHRALAGLKRLGMEEGEIAERLGYRGRYLQFARPRVTAKNAARLERLYRRERDEQRELAAIPDGPEICGDCGLSHETEHRLPVLARRLPAKDRRLTRDEVQDLRDMWPLSCFYEQGGTGYMRLRRDLMKLGEAGRAAKAP